MSEAVSARYLAIVPRKVFGHVGSPGSSFQQSIMETRWRDETNALLTRPAGTVAAALAYSGSFPASQSIDDSLSNAWIGPIRSLTNLQSGDIHIAYDFQIPFDFSYLELACHVGAGNAAFVDFDVWVSTDGSNWECAGVFLNEAAWSASEYRQYALGVDAGTTAVITWNDTGTDWPNDASEYTPPTTYRIAGTTTEESVGAAAAVEIYDAATNVLVDSFTSESDGTWEYTEEAASARSVYVVFKKSGRRPKAHGPITMEEVT